MKNNRTVAVIIDINDAKDLYKAGGKSREIALSAYDESELTSIDDLPNTWEEFCNTYQVQNGESYIDNDGNIREYKSEDYKRYNKNILPDEKSAKAIRAFIQLLQLKKCYNGDWEPDWDDPTMEKWIIYVFNNRIEYNVETKHRQSVMAFKTAELNWKFHHNFRYLLEEAKELL